MRALLLASLVLAASCGPPQPPPPVLDRINVSQVGPATVLVGSTLRFQGSGFLRGEEVRAAFSGGFAGRDAAFETGLAYVSSTELALPVDAALLALLGAEEGSFSGSVRVHVSREGQTLEDTVRVGFALVRALTPVVLGLDQTGLALMETVTVQGEGFLLAGEGETRVLLSGTFTSASGSTLELLRAALPITVLSRSEAAFIFTPELVGIQPGTLAARFEVENSHSGPGGLVVGGGRTETLTVVAPSVAGVTPLTASRGQRLEILGRGFLPEDTGAGQLTGLVLTGTFEAASGERVQYTDASPLEVFPEYLEPGALSFVLRPERDTTGQLVGLGTVPGRFDGDLRVLLRRDGDTYLGPPWLGGLDIQPTRQVVYLKYLPGFGDSLRHFGLYNVQAQVRARVLEVCRRDYAEFNVEFREARPDDFADYSVIELGGPDPNGAGLFGLDNTEGKDEGNLRLNDVVGGRNAASEEQGFYAFGGVFLESFMSFSPSLESPAPIASPRFDEIFGPFTAALGGREVQAGEFPGGSRDAQIALALKTLGTLVGNTVVHEIGHSIGLAAVAGAFHHDGSTAGLIMNPGAARSFEERGEVDGQAPAAWGDKDRAYLQSVLPRAR